MKNNKPLFVKTIIKQIDEEERLTAKQYERIGYISLVTGLVFSGVFILTQKQFNDIALVFPSISLGASLPMFKASDEVTKQNIQKQLIKNINGGKNVFRKK